MTIDARTDLTGLLNLIHDNWFLLPDVHWNRDDGVLELKLSEKRRGPFVRLLRLASVVDVRIHDPEQIELYCLNRIDHSSGCLTLAADPHCEIVVSVTEPAVIHVLHPVT
jgi:hypothetical protein